MSGIEVQLQIRIIYLTINVKYGLLSGITAIPLIKKTNMELMKYSPKLSRISVINTNLLG